MQQPLDFIRLTTRSLVRARRHHGAAALVAALGALAVPGAAGGAAIASMRGLESDIGHEVALAPVVDGEDDVAEAGSAPTSPGWDPEAGRADRHGRDWTLDDALERVGEPLAFEISPVAWFPRLVGEMRVGDGDLASIEDVYESNRSETVFAGALGFQRRGWVFRISGFSFETQGGGTLTEDVRMDGVLVPVGAPVDTEISQWAIEAALDVPIFRPYAARRFPWSSPRTRLPNGADRFDFTLGARVAVRHDSIRMIVRAPDDGVDFRSTSAWTSLQIGPQMRLDLLRDPLPLLERMVIEASVTAGPAFGGEGGSAWQVDANIAGYVTPHVSVLLGYRLRGGTFESRDFELDGSLQGLLVGATIRF